MARLSTCKGCGAKVTAAEKKVHSSKTYCLSCYEKIQRESEDYKQLVGYICEIFRIDAPTGLILKQIKQYKTEYQYSYSGMIYTLWYIKDIINRGFDTKYGIANVKYYFEDAKRYYIQQEQIKSSLSTKNYEVRKRTIKQKMKKQENTSNSLLDLGNLI